MDFKRISDEEQAAVQSGSNVVGTIVASTARLAAAQEDPRNLNRADGIRAGLSVMLGGIIALSSLIGTKDGRLCTGKPDEDPADYCNEGSLTFIAMLATKMVSNIGEVAHDSSVNALEVSFGIEVLSKAVAATELAIQKPLDGMIDPTLIEEARRYKTETDEAGEKALTMLSDLLSQRH